MYSDRPITHKNAIAQPSTKTRSPNHPPENEIAHSPPQKNDRPINHLTKNAIAQPLTKKRDRYKSKF